MAEPNRPAEGASRANKAERPKRVPVGVRQVLTYPPIPGYRVRLVNDVDDRIDRFKAAGYVPVESHEILGDPSCGSGSQEGSAVSKPVGAGRKGVLMKIKNELYQEDQAAKQREVDEIESTMQRGAESQGLTDKFPGQKLPGIQITR